MFEVLGITEGSIVFEAITGRMRERLGKIPDRVAAEAVEHFQLKVPEIQRSVESEVERVVLERMKGNPDARPVPLSGR